MLTILLNNQFSIPIISANTTSTREKFVNTMNISLAFLDTTTQDDIYNIATMINDQNSVICVYIDNVRYFTGFVEEAQINESRNETTEEITISLKLQSKTIDLLQSTYIPPIFDKVNGGSNFFINIDGKHQWESKKKDSDHATYPAQFIFDNYQKYNGH